MLKNRKNKYTLKLNKSKLGKLSKFSASNYFYRIRNFVTRNLKSVVFISAAAIVLVSIVLVITLGGGEPKEDMSQYANLDKKVLDGLEGNKEVLETEHSAEADDVLKIGITIGSEANLSGAEKGMQIALNELTQSKKIDGSTLYVAQGNINQQIQDVNSLINNNVDVIVIAGVDEYTYNILYRIIKERGIPVVALDAPIKEGYAVNVNTASNSYAHYAEQIAALGLTKAAVISENTTHSAFMQDALQVSKVASNPVIEDGVISKRLPFDAAVIDAPEATVALGAFIKNNKFPKIVCADATAGLVKQWYKLKTTGIVPQPKTSSKPSDSAKPSDSPSPSSTPKPSAKPVKITTQRLYSCVRIKSEQIGNVLVDIAFRLISGEKVKTPELTLSSGEVITNDNIDKYYSEYKDSKDSAGIYADIDKTAVDKIFK